MTGTLNVKIFLFSMLTTKIDSNKGL